MKDDVCDLEWSKKLKEKGFPQKVGKPGFYWIKDGKWKLYYVIISKRAKDGQDYVKAPLATEILREFDVGDEPALVKEGDAYSAYCNGVFGTPVKEDENPANALAALYCEVKK